MYPHERSLVERMQGRPFALLGVNSDPPERLREVIERENKGWPIWADGSTGGPIARSYNVRGWPTIYVLDQHGIIRYKNVRGDRLDAAIDQLLAQLEGGADVTP